jgi:hypothetical protein
VDFDVAVPAQTAAVHGIGASTKGLDMVVDGGEVLDNHDVRTEFEACDGVDMRKDPVGDAVASDSRRQSVASSSI